jgi:hypothetical protein
MGCWLNAPLAAGKARIGAVHRPHRGRGDAGKGRIFQPFLPRIWRGNPALIAAFPFFEEFTAMKDFSDAVFAPEIIELMTAALDASVATLPEPVSSTQVNLIAESILRTAKTGERDVVALQRIALLELQIAPRA